MVNAQEYTIVRVAIITMTLGLILGTSVGLMLNPLVRDGEPTKVALWLEVVHRVCTGIGGLGTFVTLLIVYRQFFLLRKQSELVQKNIAASMGAELYTRLDSFNRFVFEHSLEYDLLDTPYLKIDTHETRSKLHRMCELGFTFFEEIYKHHTRLKLLETEDWEEWQQNLSHFFSKPYVRDYWRTISSRYARSFRTLVDELLSKAEAQSR